jgi:hypothetical protein
VTQEERKAAAERAEFRRFVSAAGLPVVPESVVSRRPPEPDILCTITGRGPVAFELVDLISQELSNPRWPGGGYPDDTFRNVRKHLHGTYETPHPMELIAHAHPDALSPEDVWRDKFGDLLHSMLWDSPFQALWVFIRRPEDWRGPATAEIWIHAER